MFWKNFPTRVTKLLFGGVFLLAFWGSLFAEKSSCGEEIYLGVFEDVPLNPLTAEETPTVGTGKSIDETYCKLIMNVSTGTNSHCHESAGASEYTCFSHFESPAITPKTNLVHSAQAYSVHDFFMVEMLDCIDEELAELSLATTGTSTIEMIYQLKSNSSISVKLDMCIQENQELSRISIEVKNDE